MKENKQKIYIATFSEDAVAVSAEYGFGLELNDICISEYLDAEKVDETINTMEKELSDAGITDRSEVIMHGPFTEIIPASIDHRAVDFGLARLEEAYAVCKRMGINRMVVHSGYMPLLYFKEWHLEKSLYFWKKFMTDKPGEFQLYIENVFEDEPVMMKALIDGLNDARIGVCLDVGHAHAMSGADYPVAEWIRLLGQRIAHLHLHNNDGTADKHGELIDGTLNMEEILSLVSNYCGGDVTMTIESRKCRKSAVWLAELCNARTQDL